MKKYLFSLVALLAVAAACTKEETVVNEVSNDAPVFKAYVGETKALLEGNKVKWEATDHISVWNGTQTADYSTTSTGDSADFTTSDEFGSAGSYVAIYPYDGSAVFSAGSVTTTLPAAQTATDAGFDPAAHIAVASSTTTSLSFHNAVAYVKFTVPAGMDDLTSVSFKGNNSEKVAGACSVNTSTYALTATGSETATLSGTFTEGSTYYLAVAPQDYSAGYTVTITRTSGTYEMVSKATSITFERSAARDLGNLWDGSIVLEGTAVASATPMTVVAGTSGKIQFHQVYSFRGDLTAGKLNVRKSYSSTAFQSDITIPADGNYHVMYNMTTGRFKVYTQEMYVDFLRGDANGASVAPWKMLRNTSPDTVDDTAPNYTLIDYDGNLTGARCDVSAFPAGSGDYKYNGTNGNDKSMPSYYADDEEWTKGVLYDGLQIFKGTGSGDSEELSVVITGLNSSAKYDFRLVSARFNASPAARKTRFTIVGLTTYGPQEVYQGWKPANIAAMSTYDLMSIHKLDFDGISPDGEGTVTIKMKGIDTGTRADAHLNGLRIAKVL
ncbi:MAG: hypothetical protein IKZ60_02940 [Bacteroidales bacterium]|nr:hypothetical protein [Bacteroidales bacterium]